MDITHLTSLPFTKEKKIMLINIRNGMAAIFFYFKEKKEKESKNRKWCVTIPEIKSTSPE